MSSHPREPMWYCHEIENLDDDPREFHTSEAILDERLGPLAMLASLNEILRDHSSPPGTDPFSRRAAASGPTHDRGGSPTRGMGLHLEFGGPSNRRTFVLGGQNIRRDTEPDARGNHPPSRLSEFLRGSNEANGRDPQDSIPGQLMAQYLLTFLGGGGVRGNRGLPPLFGALGMGEQGSDTGRWGDYVFTQEGRWSVSSALDQIITQMMEGANSTRPVPATEEIVENLPRSVLERGDPLLEKDCAVCKEQFSIDSEDPGDKLQSRVRLQAAHPSQTADLPRVEIQVEPSVTPCPKKALPEPELRQPPGEIILERAALPQTQIQGHIPMVVVSLVIYLAAITVVETRIRPCNQYFPPVTVGKVAAREGGTGETGDTPRIPGGWRDSLD
ncbi:hypothetical protein EW145_g2762 [Phellinidium pouzarii]|uniref:Uncharacterized protein n=1 Tax=Phellinidium pouzarii TaxID=167371 RepID=A0A4S4L9U0_9AGAM|nr:hypothetical protein EW145_g2762 [Phellinidium pouzarii]